MQMTIPSQLAGPWAPAAGAAAAIASNGAG
ncbi:hypothetical protein SAMN06296416_103133 [Pseudoxanthomonas wuyuanensis]|uniref:Uncharacterized protein n=1 Tax=Pseudoxanthomonas wuyuanensis TaxID=1073196 RepID=A0A286D6A3_9GAMM|nr:hypothetical protein SAMN06296416_103133 [Pseudoxanthomonas wuyuanensis]